MLDVCACVIVEEEKVRKAMRGSLCGEVRMVSETAKRDVCGESVSASVTRP
jgi:hypothetical protein